MGQMSNPHSEELQGLEKQNQLIAFLNADPEWMKKHPIERVEFIVELKNELREGLIASSVDYTIKLYYKNTIKKGRNK